MSQRFFKVINEMLMSDKEIFNCFCFLGNDYGDSQATGENKGSSEKGNK